MNVVVRLPTRPLRGLRLVEGRQALPVQSAVTLSEAVTAPARRATLQCWHITRRTICGFEVRGAFRTAQGRHAPCSVGTTATDASNTGVLTRPLGLEIVLPTGTPGTRLTLSRRRVEIVTRRWILAVAQGLRISALRLYGVEGCSNTPGSSSPTRRRRATGRRIRSTGRTGCPTAAIGLSESAAAAAASTRTRIRRSHASAGNACPDSEHRKNPRTAVHATYCTMWCLLALHGRSQQPCLATALYGTRVPVRRGYSKEGVQPCRCR